MNNVYSLILIILCLGCNNKIRNVDSKNTSITINQIELTLQDFLEFERQELEKELFIKELIEFDSLLQYDNYYELAKEYKPRNITIKTANKIISLDFAQIYCKEYEALKKEKRIQNIENLRISNKLIIRCRDIASDLDVFPIRTGNLDQDCINYLAAIKQLVKENSDTLNGFTIDDYKKLEQSKNITTNSNKFIFRKKFLKFLNQRYYVSIE